MKVLQLIAIITLVGCSSITKEPVVEVQEVVRVVKVRCTVEYPKEPEPLLTALPPDVGVYDKGVAALKELEAYRSYSFELKAALMECALNFPSNM